MSDPFPTDHPPGFVFLLRDAARDDPDRIFARYRDTALTMADMDRKSDAVAAGLRRAGIGRGDRVALMLRNGPQALATLFGIGKAGAIWVPVNVEQKGDGLRYILEHSTPRAIVHERDLRQTVEGCGADLGNAVLIGHGDGPSGSLAAMLADDARFDEPLPQPADPFAISYTSGTTGPPKGVIVTHSMLRFAGEAAARVADVRDRDVLFMWEPLYHIGGAQLIVMPLIRDVALAMVDRFSASRFWDEVRAQGATQIHYLGGILQILLKQPESDRDRDHGVRIAWGGGCPRHVWRPFEERFGVTIRECYGMTEASSFTTFNGDGTLGSVGRPLPWFEVEVHGEDGRPLPPGEQGEIVVRPKVPGAVLPAYWNNPQATATALRDGAMHSGDRGSWDADGRLYFHGRMTDSFRCRGENVSAWEVEHVVATHPAVEECAVIGVESEIGEQDIKLFVKAKPGSRLELAALARWLEKRLARYQVPRYYAQVADFERTPSHRIMKHALSRRIDDGWDRLADSDS